MEIKVDCFDIRQIADSGQCFRMKEHPTKKDTFTVVVGVDYIEITQAAGSHVDTELFVIKQYEEEINYKLLTPDQQDEGKYYKFNEKVLFRTDSKTQMEYLSNGVKNSIVTPNEARRKLDMSNAEGGDRLYANGNVIPLEKAGVQYAKKDGQQTTEEDDVKGGEENAEDEKV